MFFSLPRPARLAGLIAAIVLLTSTLCASAWGAEPRSMDKNSDGAFTGIALITEDLNWFETFQRPETPQFSGKDSLKPSEKAAVATFFSNPRVESGRVRVRCSVTAFEPSGETRALPSGMCYDGPPLPPNTLYPTFLDFKFGVGEDDARGIAGFRITMRDLNSGREVTVVVSFMQDTGQ